MVAGAPVPVTVVTGFLGAGKTTLVNRWLADIPRGEVAVIVNEHGAIGIDAELLAARVETIVEITGGCICCATQAELVLALDRLASAQPRRILVETSGAASPAAVLRAIGSGGRDDAFVLDGVVTVVDATRVDALVEHDLALEQLGYADVVFLSRTDLVSSEHASAVVATQNGAATVASSGTLAEVLARRAELPPARTPVASSPHVYESIALTLPGSVDGERFADFMESELARFAGRLFRTKGILSLPDVEEKMIVQGIGDAVEVTFGEAWGAAERTSRLVVVGFGLERDRITSAWQALRQGA